MAFKVCLDAGHYGKYNQSPVLKSYYESDMTWKLHNYLATELQKYGITVIKTRANQATDLELTARGRKAAGCNLFLSIHSNAASNSSAKYCIAIHLADKAGVAYDDKAKDLAGKLTKTVASVMGTTGRTGTRPADWDRDGNGKKDDEWYGVLQGAKLVGVPGIIMEHGFHTNLEQAKWLSNDANLQKLAVAEAKTIAEWLGAGVKAAEKTTTSSKTAAKKTIKASGYSTYGPAASFSRNYTVQSSDGWANMRDKADLDSKIMTAIPSGKKVRCWGYYSIKNAITWLYVVYVDGNTTYEGFVSKNLLK